MSDIIINLHPINNKSCDQEENNPEMYNYAKKADRYGILSAKLVKQSPNVNQNSVDIIMPTYNSDMKLMERAIQSILNQTFNNWKLFIVKDGGDADIFSIVKKFDDPHIEYYEISHKGKGAALNFAISKGKARYIAYLDDDDVWYPNHLQEAVSFMTKNNVQFLYTDAYEVFIRKERDKLKEVLRRNLHKGVITDITLWQISHINVVHERSLLDKAGAYDETKRYFIDWDMFQRLAKYTKPYHLRVITCEHYMYLDKDNKISNVVSHLHGKDPELSEKMCSEMFAKAFEILTPTEFAEFVKDWLQLKYFVENVQRTTVYRFYKWLQRLRG